MPRKFDVVFFMSSETDSIQVIQKKLLRCSMFSAIIKDSSFLNTRSSEKSRDTIKSAKRRTNKSRSANNNNPDFDERCFACNQPGHTHHQCKDARKDLKAIRARKLRQKRTCQNPYYNENQT